MISLTLHGQTWLLFASSQEVLVTLHLWLLSFSLQIIGIAWWRLHWSDWDLWLIPKGGVAKTLTVYRGGLRSQSLLQRQGSKSLTWRSGSRGRDGDEDEESF